MVHANALGSMQKPTIHALSKVCMDPWLYFDAWIHAVLAWIHAVSHGLCYFQIHTRLHGLMVSAESCVAYARAWVHAISHGLRDPGYRDALLQDIPSRITNKNYTFRLCRTDTTCKPMACSVRAAVVAYMKS